MTFRQMLFDFRARWLVTAARRMTLVGCLVVLLVGAFYTQWYRIEAKYQKAHAGALGRAETFYIPPYVVLRLASLGYETTMADLMFIRGHAYALSHLFTDRIFTWLDDYIGAVIYLDPDNPRIYHWASQMAKYGQLITNESIDRSNAYARRGIERFPNDWRLYLDVGFNLYFEYKYDTEEEMARSRDEALEYFAIAASLPNSQLDPNFLTELYMRRNDTKMALFQAYQAYHEASAEERHFLRWRIAQLESEEAAQALKDEEDAWKRSFSFVPFGMFQIIGEPLALAPPASWSEIGRLYHHYRPASAPGASAAERNDSAEGEGTTP